MNKKILIVGGHGDSLYYFRLDFINSLKEKGYSIHCLAPEISDTTLKKLEALNIKFSFFSFDRKSTGVIEFLSNLKNLFIQIKSIKPDIIFSYNHKPVILGSICGRAAGVKNIFSLITGTGHLFHSKTFLERIRFVLGCLLFKLSAKFNKAFVFQNPDDLNYFVSLGIIDKDKAVQVNGSGVSLTKYSFSEIKNHPVYLCMARLIESKGLREYAEACKIVRNSIPDARFLLAGDNDSHQDSIKIEEIKNHWHQKYGIEYLGFIEDSASIIKQASCYVLLSYNEGTPRSVLEAMAIGRPIVTTDVSGCRETVKNGYNGYLVPKQDPQKSAEAMLIFQDLEICRTFGENSRRFCEEKYDSLIVANIMISMIEERVS